jgi:hypothetical protein
MKNRAKKKNAYGAATAHHLKLRFRDGRSLRMWPGR